MDHLRSTVGLLGYAQVDPKTEYKREGMKEFDAMWEGVQDKITDTVFRMEEDGGLPGIGLVDRRRRPRAGPASRANGDSIAASRKPPSRTASRATRSPSRSATAAKRSAATIPARAAAARSTRTATCGRRCEPSADP